MAVCGTNDWDEEKLLNLISAYNVVFYVSFTRLVYAAIILLEMHTALAETVKTDFYS